MIGFKRDMSHSTRVYEDIFELLPSQENPTPLVRIRKLNPAPDFKLYAKLERYNPFSSVKDRAAWGMLRRLEEGEEMTWKRPPMRFVMPITCAIWGLFWVVAVPKVNSQTIPYFFAGLVTVIITCLLTGSLMKRIPKK
jgi:hypothetical protein